MRSATHVATEPHRAATPGRPWIPAALALALCLGTLATGAALTLGAEPTPSVAATLGTEPTLSVAATLGSEPADGVDPSPAILAVLQGGDPRSEGEGPGLVGSPIAILLGVIVLGLATAAVTGAIALVARRGR